MLSGSEAISVLGILFEVLPYRRVKIHFWLGTTQVQLIVCKNFCIKCLLLIIYKKLWRPKDSRILAGPNQIGCRLKNQTESLYKLHFCAIWQFGFDLLLLVGNCYIVFPKPTYSSLLFTPYRASVNGSSLSIVCSERCGSEERWWCSTSYLNSLDVSQTRWRVFKSSFF